MASQHAMMLDLLKAVVAGGTGKGARIANLDVAGKTGTTQDHRDAWFIGFTSDVIVGVWVGNDDNSPMNGVFGGDLPASIWHDFVERAEPLIAPKRSPAAAAPSVKGTTAALAPAAPPDVKALVRGFPGVIDTGTLAFRDKIVHLQGLDGQGGRLARQLAQYMRGQEVRCEHKEDDAQRCQIDGRDLSTMILEAGGARASPDAPPELLAAEEQARSARVGIWRYQQR